MLAVSQNKFNVLISDNFKVTKILIDSFNDVIWFKRYRLLFLCEHGNLF